MKILNFLGIQPNHKHSKTLTMNNMKKYIDMSVASKVKKYTDLLRQSA